MQPNPPERIYIIVKHYFRYLSTSVFNEKEKIETRFKTTQLYILRAERQVFIYIIDKNVRFVQHLSDKLQVTYAHTMQQITLQTMGSHFYVRVR